MSTLTETSVSVRKLLLFGVILVIAYLILNAAFNAMVASLKKPPAPFVLTATNDYGQLPAPKFVSTQNTAGLTMTLENVEGRPPESTTAAKVYKMPEKLYSSLSLDRARAFGRNLDFTNEPTAQSKTLYLFTDPKDPLRTLQIDIINSNFKLRYDYTQKPDLLKNLQTADKNQLLKEARNYVGTLFDSTFQNGDTQTEYLKVDPASAQLIPATTKNDPIQGITVNFFRPDMDGLKIVTPTFFTSPVNVTHIPTTDPKTQYISVSYTYWPVAANSYSFYSLRSTDQAWQDVKDGYGTLISMGYNTPDKIIIRNIYMAYYDSEVEQEYMQPIYVFEGDNNFVAYLPAVSSELLISQ